jgi:hypothetical protein
MIEFASEVREMWILFFDLLLVQVSFVPPGAGSVDLDHVSAMTQSADRATSEFRAKNPS